VGIADWLDESTPDRREVTVCFDRRLVSELVAAKEQLKSFEADGMLEKPEPLRKLEARVAAIEDKVRAKSRTLVFEGIGWGKWRDLMGKFPPAPDQLDTFERAVKLGFMPHAVENIGYNAEEFIPAAIAASCAEPGISVEEASRMLRTSPPGVIERVWTAVLDVNLGGANDPFVGAVLAASGQARPTAKKSKPQ
jgi:hypothetical protein